MKCSNLTAFFSFLLFALPYLGKGQSNIPLFSTEDYLVSSTIAVPLSVNGQALASNTIYRVGLVTLGTGTHTGASFLVWKDNTSGKWKVRNVAISGSTSNHPLLAIDSSNIVVVRTNHINKYNVRAFVESFPVGVPAAVPSMLGESYQWQRDVSDLVYLDGNVGIGKANPSVKLAVSGTIKSREINVITDDWPDYVFGDSYSLQSLDSLYRYTKTVGHLPGMPSSEEVCKNGQNLGEMNKNLLRKIEELTLYIYQINLQLKELRKQIDVTKH